MSYHQKSYWPAIYVAAAFSGLAAIFFGWILLSLVLEYGQIVSQDRAPNTWHPLLAIAMFLGLFFIFGGGCVGAFMKTWWGRGILTFVAALYLLVFPIGTILGVFVLRGLFVHKREFQ